MLLHAKNICTHQIRERSFLLTPKSILYRVAGFLLTKKGPPDVLIIVILIVATKHDCKYIFLYN